MTYFAIIIACFKEFATKASKSKQIHTIPSIPTEIPLSITDRIAAVAKEVTNGEDPETYNFDPFDGAYIVSRVVGELIDKMRQNVPQPPVTAKREAP